MKSDSSKKVVQMFKHNNASAKTLNVADKFNLIRGGQLSDLDIAYETWGSLNKDKSNVIVIFTGLSANSHVASSSIDQTPGWWESVVGKDKAINTEDHYVICVNTLGSCFGSTSPVSINKKTNEPYRLTFPELTVEDLSLIHI